MNGTTGVEMNSGVTQGSVLSPLLSTAYMDEIMKEVEDHTTPTNLGLCMRHVTGIRSVTRSIDKMDKNLKKSGVLKKKRTKKMVIAGRTKICAHTHKKNTFLVPLY